MGKQQPRAGKRAFIVSERRCGCRRLLPQSGLAQRWHGGAVGMGCLWPNQRPPWADERRRNRNWRLPQFGLAQRRNRGGMGRQHLRPTQRAFKSDKCCCRGGWWLSKHGVTRHGTVVAWGDNTYGQIDVPAGLANVVAISSSYHCLALCNDGTVVAWGRNILGEAYVPFGLTNVIAIAAGHNHSLALCNDGTVVAWGDGYAPPPSQTAAPHGLTNVQEIAQGPCADHGLAIISRGVAPSIMMQPKNIGSLTGSTAIFKIMVYGTGPFAYQWQLNGTNIAGAGTQLTITNVQPASAGYKLL
jgi:hypothetical protein